MIFLAIIVVIIIIGLVVLKDFINDNGHGGMDIGVFFGVTLSIFFVIEICIINDIIEEPQPKAMDVYQGRTTLEYTIRDGVKVDSVVVWKEK